MFVMGYIFHQKVDFVKNAEVQTIYGQYILELSYVYQHICRDFCCLHLWVSCKSENEIPSFCEKSISAQIYWFQIFKYLHVAQSIKRQYTNTQIFIEGYGCVSAYCKVNISHLHCLFYAFTFILTLMRLYKISFLLLPFVEMSQLLCPFL